MILDQQNLQSSMEEMDVGKDQMAKKSPTRWQQLPVPIKMTPLTSQNVLKAIEKQINQKNVVKPKKEKPKNRSIDDDWNPSW